MMRSGGHREPPFLSGDIVPLTFDELQFILSQLVISSWKAAAQKLRRRVLSAPFESVTRARDPGVGVGSIVRTVAGYA